MRARRLHSSIIDRIVFDDEASVLTIRFRQTGDYIYYDVPRAVYDALCSAASPGAYFNEYIRGRFRCRPARRKFRPSP